jgi:cytochrome P450
MPNLGQWERSDALPPGPVWPDAVQTAVWGLRPVALYDWCARRYGTPFTLRMLGGEGMVHFSDPDAIREIFALSADDFSAGAMTRDILAPFLGPNSLLVLDGDQHRDERRIVVRSFHADSFATHERTIEECARRSMAAWPRGRSFAMHEQMQAITLEVILRAMFGIDDRDQLVALLTPLRTFLSLGGSLTILAPPLRELPMVRRKWHRFKALHDDIDRAILALIGRRRAEPQLDVRADILSALVRATDELGNPLSDPVIRDHLMTLLLAGHDTTATALAWAFDLLAHHPAVADRLAEEVRSGDDAYLDAVIKEVLRLRPVIAEAGRMLTRPCTVAGHTYPAGVVVTANVHLAHRRPDVYPQPDVFRPERFLEGAPDVHAWLPFGGGIRRCLGVAFATLELRTVLRTVIPELTMTPARRRLEKPRRRAVTLIPRHGAPVIQQTRPPTSIACDGTRELFSAR